MTITHLIAVALVVAAVAFLLLAVATVAALARAGRFRRQRDDARAQLATTRTKLAALERRSTYLRPVSPRTPVVRGDALTRVINGRYR